MSRKRTIPESGLRPEILLPYSDQWELYHNSFSLCSRKIRICLEELRIPYKSHHIELIETGSYDTAKPAFLNINPGGTVPVLIHHGHPVYESHEQIAYLAKQGGKNGEMLLGSDDIGRAEIGKWVDRASIVGDPVKASHERAGHCIPGLTLPLFAAMMLYIPYREIFKGLMTHPHKKRPMMFFMLKMKGQLGLVKIASVNELVNRCRNDLCKHLDELETQLQSHGRKWITGDTFTLADISWAVLLDRAMEANWQKHLWGGDRRPAVRAYWERITARPSYQKQVDELRCTITIKGIADVARMKREQPEYRAFLEGTE